MVLGIAAGLLDFRLRMGNKTVSWIRMPFSGNSHQFYATGIATFFATLDKGSTLILHCLDEFRIIGVMRCVW